MIWDIRNAVILFLLAIMYAGYRYLAYRYAQDIEAIQSYQSQELQRFLRRFDHELKNPLTAIQFALVNLTAADPDLRQKSSQSIATQTRRIGDLLITLRKLVELNQVTIEEISVDAATLIEEVVVLAQDKLDTPRPIEVISTATQTIKGDKYLLLLALYNVVDNALKFSDNTATVSIHAYDEGGNVILQVHDTGFGIREADIQHVWEELYRGHIAQPIIGSGLGLALVKAIVERHQGLAHIESLEGDHTTVTLTLPAYQVKN